MAETAMSKRLEIRHGIRPLKSMSTHSICLPMALPMASTSSMSKPVRLPFSTNSMGGNVASVPTRSTLSWACTLVLPRASAAMLARRRLRRMVIMGKSPVEGLGIGKTKGKKGRNSVQDQLARYARGGDDGHANQRLLLALGAQDRRHQRDGAHGLARGAEQRHAAAPHAGVHLARAHGKAGAAKDRKSV